MSLCPDMVWGKNLPLKNYTENASVLLKFWGKKVFLFFVRGIYPQQKSPTGLKLSCFGNLHGSARHSLKPRRDLYATMLWCDISVLGEGPRGSVYESYFKNIL